MRTDLNEFHDWLLNGVSSVKGLRRKIKQVMRCTVNPAYRSDMLKITVNEAYAEELLGLDKPVS